MSTRTEDVVMVAIPRSALTVVEPARPVTITQRNCLAIFGLEPRDFLRMAGRAFPVARLGKLRIAKYEDVESALTVGARHRRPGERDTHGKVVSLDPEALLAKAGFRRVVK